ncbi:CRISPR-associated helicase Cas3' [Robertmurraya andreesenii]|uniref:CRISPR-associated endonuclease/helicase Cas3 n=1 Tax=Anoxybacillus andreesenii TaxID=1325932 RepID=A0ABT9V8V1_9BACL|nr:CRISPR-associated helicase Cas3' [Robertmurraya andreesenii]MDQ0157388.1 CRISPR-associated endonuclease/helicase Cas3 [Robertmurraya andreesenii]
MLLTEEKIDLVFKEMSKKLDSNKQGFTPLEFQKQIVHAHLNEGKNVILHAPTGAGKTLAALAPFYISKNLSEDISYPNQTIYVLPMRTLAHSLAKEAKEISESWRVTTQTGELQEDPFFINGDVIFTTIDQALSGALTLPLSLPERLANINAGVWPGNYLIFDEFHLLDPKRSFQTTIHLLKQLCVEMQLTRFTIMTATLSRELREILAKELNAVHIEVSESDLPKIKSQFNKKRKVVTHSARLSADEIIEKHNAKTIVIVNQVDRAKALYNEIKNNTLIDTDLFLLHSQLLSDERKSVEGKLKDYFGKNRNNKNAILIATQVIEVGLDITSDTMLTEVSSAQSFLQRIGRNARFEKEEGAVHVYSIKDYESDRPWLPYEEDEVSDAESYLQAHNNTYFDYLTSNAMINELYGQRDKELWEQIKLNLGNHYKVMAKAYEEHKKGLASDLIRSIKSVSILIHDNPPNDEDIYLYETISISLGKIKGFISQLIKSSIVFQGKIQKVVYEKKNLTLRDIEGIKDVQTHDLIIIHPSLAAYRENSGLELGTPSADKTYRFPLKNDKSITKRYDYKMDTFREHVQACLMAFQQICYPKSIHTISRLAKAFNIEMEDIERIIRFVIITHDIGKLAKEWQIKAMNVQLLADPNFNQETLLAHMDNPSRKRANLPEHSVLGAVIANYLFKTEVKYREFEIPVLTAIAHHHSAIVERFEWHKPFKGTRELLFILEENGWLFSIEEMLNSLKFAEEKKVKKSWSDQWSYWHVDHKQYWLYLFLVRQLRISDQKSFEFIDDIRKQKATIGDKNG